MPHLLQRVKCHVYYFFSTAQQALVEVLAQLEEDTSDQCAKNKSHGTIDIFLQPPINENVQTDEDTDKSDDEYEFNVNHLGRKLLSTPCEIRRQILPTDQDADDTCMDNGSPTLACGPTAGPADIKKSKSTVAGRSEISNTGYGTCPKDKASQQNKQARKRKVPSTTDNHEKQTTHDDAGEESWSPRVSTKLLQAAPRWKKAKRVMHTPQIYTGRLFTGLNELKTPQQFFLTFFDEALQEHIVTQTNLYAGQKNTLLSLTREELLTFFGGLLLSGYSKLPHRRLYWDSDDDVPKLLPQSMRRNRFEDILKNLHLADNTALDPEDRLAKLRPFMTMLQERFRDNNYLDENLSIDESMIPYYGRHFAKQYIRGKPIRFGFKNWALCSSTGYMYGFDIYTGRQPGVTYEHGLGADVVIGLLEQACVPPHSGHKVYFDNFFTSYRLLHYLHEFGYEAAGTVRENRTGQCTLKSTAAMKKEPRGSYDFRSCSDVLMIRWHDNSVVTIASNFGTVEEGRVQRWSQNQHKIVSVSQPTMFRLYNQGMGGVDQLDQQVACYRTRIRQRKWWWPIFVYLFDVTVVNAWYLFRKVHRSGESLFDFRRQLAVSLLKCYGVPSIQGRRASAVLSDVRYDGNNHWIVRGDTDRRCKACGKKTIYRCEKCDVGLHPDCHKYYHIA